MRKSTRKRVQPQSNEEFELTTIFSYFLKKKKLK